MKKPRPWSQGEKNARAKLSEDEVLTMRTLWKAGFSVRQLAIKFKRPAGTIYSAVSRITWSYLP